MQLYPLRFVPDNSKIDFMKLRHGCFVASIVLSIASIILLFVMKLNFGIDFAGGIALEVRINQQPDLAKMRSVLGELKIGEVILQSFGEENDVSIRVATSADEKTLQENIQRIKNTLQDHFDYQIDYRKIDFVGPQVGAQLVFSAAQALALAFLAIMVYIWFRFEWQFGVGVLVALVHDAILSLGFMSVTQLDFNLSSIAALLTIIGYSVNDSVVIYDRIRENLRKYASDPIDDIINRSMNETLSRTILTVITTLIANSALIIFGGEAIHSFSVLVFCGILIGTYSSIFISAPILKLLKLEKYSAAKQ